VCKFPFSATQWYLPLLLTFECHHSLCFVLLPERSGNLLSTLQCQISGSSVPLDDDQLPVASPHFCLQNRRFILRRIHSCSNLGPALLVLHDQWWNLYVWRQFVHLGGRRLGIGCFRVCSAAQRESLIIPMHRIRNLFMLQGKSRNLTMEFEAFEPYRLMFRKY
jgi:hypothetical protein